MTPARVVAAIMINPYVSDEEGLEHVLALTPSRTPA